MRDFRELGVWQLGIQFASSIYRRTRGFPKDEQYGLTSQIRRAASSIPANIAEGVGRESDAELLRFVRVALGSLNEVETYLVLAREIGYISPGEDEELESEARDLGVRLRNFARKLETDLGKRP